MTFGSLFSGIGGIDLGLERAGMECKWQGEIDPFCRKVLAKHWPDVRRYEDVKSVGGETLEPVDVIAGGFPCQDNSQANQTGEGRKGLRGDKSSLWWEMWRLVGELRPRYIFVENVPGLLTVNGGQDFGTIIECLAKGGYDAEWESVCASHFGAPHHRERLFLVAYSNDIGLDEDGIRLADVQKEKRETRSRVIAGTTVMVGGDWETEPPLLCVDDGVSPDLGQIRGLGNAVVPQCAEWNEVLSLCKSRVR